MARLPDVIDDRSSLSGPVMDVRRRFGWLLRTCRTHGSTRGTTGGQFARALGVTPGSVTKWEKGADQPDDAVIAGYERHSGLPAGLLRSVVEELRRAFRLPSRSASDGSRVFDLDALSRRVQPTMTGRPRGIDWLHLADALDTGAMRLPDFAARPLLDRLVSETARSIGPEFMVRFSALARIRISAYHQVTQDAVLTFALDPDAQVVGEVMTALAERPTDELVERMTELMDHPNLPVVRGACRTLITAAAVGGEPIEETLRRHADRMVATYAARAGDPDRHTALSGVLRNLPPVWLRIVEDRGLPPLSPVPAIDPVSRAGTAYRAARSTAARVTSLLGSREEPLLARTLFEAMFDPRSIKMRGAIYVLMALPYRELVAEAVLDLAEQHPDPEVRAAAARLPVHLGTGGTAIAERWSHDPDRERQVAGLVAMGHHADLLDEEWLDQLVHRAEPEVARRAVYAAGMGGHASLLDKWIGDDDVPSGLRLGAQWWREHGGRVTDR